MAEVLLKTYFQSVSCPLIFFFLYIYLHRSCFPYPPKISGRKAHGKNMGFNLVKPMEAQMNERIVDGGDRVLTINKYRVSSPHSVAE